MRRLLPLLLLIAPTCAWAQRPATPNVLVMTDSVAHPGAGLEAFGMIVGHWRGEGLGGTVEEFWTPASGGSMTGLFRLLHGDRLVLTEHMAIDTLDGRPTMRVRHFSPDFVAWEEKSESVAFPLIRAEQGAIYLDGLTIRASGPDGLVFHLLMTDGEGVSREEIIRYRRVR